MGSEEAPTKKEAIAVKSLTGQWYIVMAFFFLDRHDNFRPVYPTYLHYGDATLKLLKPTRAGRLIYEEVVIKNE